MCNRSSKGQGEKILLEDDWGKKLVVEPEATTEKSENQNVLLQSILAIGRKKFLRKV